VDLQKLGGVAALSEALIYVSAFVFFGVIWDFPAGAGTIQKFSFLADNQTILSIVNLVIYVIFGTFLAVLVVALHNRLKAGALALTQISSVFGIIWVGLIIASGMIANIGLGAVIDLSAKDPEQAMKLLADYGSCC